MQHTSLSDEELVSRIASLCLEGRRLVARLIVHLIEVEDRALDKKSACSSMWAFCTERLKMSEGETSRRLNAAKLVRRFPSVLGRIERGEIHVSALRQLGPYLKEENVNAVLDEAKGKTRTQLDEMIARAGCLARAAERADGRDPGRGEDDDGHRWCDAAVAHVRAGVPGADRALVGDRCPRADDDDRRGVR